MSTEILKQYLRSFDCFHEDTIDMMFQTIHIAVSSAVIPENYQIQELRFLLTGCEVLFAAYCNVYCDMDADKAMESSQELMLRIFKEADPAHEH